MREWRKFKIPSCRCWRLARDLTQSQKSRVLHKMGQFSNLFNFPSNISDWSSSSLPETLSNTPCHSQTNFHFCIISSSNLQEKGMGFSYYLIVFHDYIMCFLDFWVVVWVLWHLLFMYELGLLYYEFWVLPLAWSNLSQQPTTLSYLKTAKKLSCILSSMHN